MARDPVERAESLKRAREAAARKRAEEKLRNPPPPPKPPRTAQPKLPGTREISKMTRLDHIEEMIELLTDRMKSDEVSDSGLAQLSKARAELLAQRDSLDNSKPKPGTGLSEFERKLRERQERRAAYAASEDAMDVN